MYHGERVVIAKHNLPVADLVPHKPEGRRKPGSLGGQVEAPDEALFGEYAEINAMFYGDGACDS